MAINKRNTDLLKERFEDEFQLKPNVIDESIHGCDAVFIEIEDSVNFDSLERITKGIGNTMTIKAKGEGLLRICVW